LKKVYIKRKESKDLFHFKDKSVFFFFLCKEKSRKTKQERGPTKLAD